MRRRRKSGENACLHCGCESIISHRTALVITIKCYADKIGAAPTSFHKCTWRATQKKTRIDLRASSGDLCVWMVSVCSNCAEHNRAIIIYAPGCCGKYEVNVRLSCSTKVPQIIQIRLFSGINGPNKSDCVGKRSQSTWIWRQMRGESEAINAEQPARNVLREKKLTHQSDDCEKQFRPHVLAIEHVINWICTGKNVLRQMLSCEMWADGVSAVRIVRLLISTSGIH